MNIRTVAVSLAAGLALTGAALAHHSFSAEFDASKPVKLTGIVTKVEWTNPHVWFYINVKDEATGNVTNWGAEMGPHDGWLDVDGSPHSNEVKFTERFRRPTFGKLEIDLTIEDPKAYTKPFTVRINQQVMADDELIEFICNENQQFRRRVKVN